MKIKVRDNQIDVLERDAVHIGKNAVTQMAEDLVAKIERDRGALLELFDGDPDRIYQSFATTGDVMVKAAVSLGYTTQYRLHVELYVCRIERHAHFEI